jgi:hypothetical protein
MPQDFTGVSGLGAVPEHFRGFFAERRCTPLLIMTESLKNVPEKDSFAFAVQRDGFGIVYPYAIALRGDGGTFSAVLWS